MKTTKAGSLPAVITMPPRQTAPREPEPQRPDLNWLIQAIAAEVCRMIAPEIARMTPAIIKPALLDVKQAAVYLGRSEQAVQHLIFKKELPVVRGDRRVHLHRPDLDQWIEKNKY